MVGANVNQPNSQPWLSQDVVAFPGEIHPLPKHIEKFLPKFDHDKKDLVEDHIKKFMLHGRLLNFVIKKLSNDIIYIKNNVGKGSSNPKKIFSYPSKKPTPPTNKTNPPTKEINKEDFLKSFKIWVVGIYTNTESGVNQY